MSDVLTAADVQKRIAEIRDWRDQTRGRDMGMATLQWQDTDALLNQIDAQKRVAAFLAKELAAAEELLAAARNERDAAVEAGMAHEQRLRAENERLTNLLHEVEHPFDKSEYDAMYERMTAAEARFIEKNDHFVASARAAGSATDALREIEWKGEPAHGSSTCPACGGLHIYGRHEADCSLAAALAVLGHATPAADEERQAG